MPCDAAATALTAVASLEGLTSQKVCVILHLIQQDASGEHDRATWGFCCGPRVCYSSKALLIGVWMKLILCDLSAPWNIFAGFGGFSGC